MNTQCDDCGRDRRSDEPEYSPVQLLTGQALGWYSGDDGEICGECMAALVKLANGR